MFDKTVLHTSRTEYVPYEKTIIEKRAPTDESIRIWEDMREKAYKSILDSIEIRDNTLNLNAILYKDNSGLHTVCKYRLLLNGTEITGEIKVNDFYVKDKSDLYRKIIDCAATHISVEILKFVDSSSSKHSGGW